MAGGWQIHYQGVLKLFNGNKSVADTYIKDEMTAKQLLSTCSKKRKRLGRQFHPLPSHFTQRNGWAFHYESVLALFNDNRLEADAYIRDEQRAKQLLSTCAKKRNRQRQLQAAMSGKRFFTGLIVVT